MQSPEQNTTSLIKAVLFDLDGVLIHSYDAWFRLFNDALEHFGYPRISESVFRKHWGQSTQQDIKIFMPGRTINEVREYFTDYYSTYLSYIALDPYALPVLQYLQTRSLRLGCVTNSHRDITETILREHGLLDFFTVILTADDVVQPKPAPEILVAACTQLQVQTHNVVFVGDTQTDIEAGTRAGCIMVGYRIRHSINVQNLIQLQNMVEKMIDHHQSNSAR